MKKTKIITDRAPISSEEIAQRRDFAAVIQGAQAVKTSPKRNNIQTTLLISATIVVIIACVIIYMGYSDKSETIAAKPAFINPPIPSKDLAYNDFRINTDSAQTITLANNSVITVPAHAFVDSVGKAVSGTITLSYREMHTQADIFYSGIPMDYDSAGTKYILESAGMIEIRAFQNGAELRLAGSKSICIRLRSYQDGRDYNLYELDTVARNWVFRGKDSIVRKTTAMEVTEQKPSVAPQITEAESKLNQQLEALAQTVIEKPVQPKKIAPDKWTFNIKAKKSEFPELSNFDNTLWEVDETNVTFRPNDAKETWHDVKLEKSGAETYMAVFSKNDKTVRYPVRPVYEGKDLARAQLLFSQQYKKYETALAERTKKEAEIVAEMERLQKEWREYIANETKRAYLQNAVYQTETEMYRQFNIKNMGVWNCDRPANYPTSKMINASFVLQDNRDIIVDRVFIINKNRNSVFQIYNYKNNGFDLVFDMKAENILIAVTAMNTVAVYDTEQCKELVKNMRASRKIPIEPIDASTFDVAKYLSKQ